ncbi:hypothetical protein [Streptomyces sp. NPDC050738]|uniref:hypothetical protein n=1 Tax=Streptomyces sp. NPDC050738 TaxID=3154744 RepID=UPI0034384A6D
MPLATGWGAIEACAACADAIPDGEVIAVAEVVSQTPASGESLTPAVQRLLTKHQGLAVRDTFAYLNKAFPALSPDARLFALILTLRTVCSGTTTFSADDITRLRLEDPKAAVTEFHTAGWADYSVSELLSAPAQRPASVRVLRDADMRHDLQMGDRTRSRASGWVTKSNSYRRLRNQGSAVKLASLFLAAHADPAGHIHVCTREIAVACAVRTEALPAVLDRLVASGWIEYLHTTDDQTVGQVDRSAQRFVPGAA